MVVVDTSVWVEYLRNPGSDSGRVLDLLLSRQEVRMVGMVLSEILQGTRNPSQLDTLRERLTALRFLETDMETWIKVAEIALELRGLGAMIPMTDVIVAATAMQHDEPVYAIDAHFQRVPGLRLYESEV